MRPALTIAGHHLRRVIRNPGLVLLLLAIPVTLAVIEYAAFGRTVAAGKLPPARVLFLDQDDTFLSGALPQFFAGGPAKELFELSQVTGRDEALRLFKRGEAAALVVVPAGFQSRLLSGARGELTFYPNPAQDIGPEMARGMLEMTATIANALHAQAAAPLARLGRWGDEGHSPTSDEIAGLARELFEAGRRLEGLDGLDNLSVPVRRPGQDDAQAGMAGDPSRFFAYIFPGLVFFGLLFIAQSLAFRLMRDRLRGLQRRVAMAPVSRDAIVFGGVLYLVASLLVLLAFLAGIGAVVFGIRLRDPAALLALGVGFTCFAAGLHLLSIALARNDRTASFAGTVVVLVLSLVGGSFVPVEQYPPLLRAVAALVPNGAAQQGFVDVLVHRAPWNELARHVAVVWAWGLVVLSLAVIAERRRLARD